MRRQRWTLPNNGVWWLGVMRAGMIVLAGFAAWGSIIVGVSRMADGDTAAGCYLHGDRGKGLTHAAQVRLSSTGALRGAAAMSLTEPGGQRWAEDADLSFDLLAGGEGYLTYPDPTADLPDGACAFTPVNGASLNAGYAAAGRFWAVDPCGPVNQSGGCKLIYQADGPDWDGAGQSWPQAWPQASWDWPARSLTYLRPDSRPVAAEALPPLRTLDNLGGELYYVGVGMSAVLSLFLVAFLAFREFTAWRTEAG